MKTLTYLLILIYLTLYNIGWDTIVGHLGRDTLMFEGGILVTLGVVWLVEKLKHEEGDK